MSRITLDTEDLDFEDLKNLRSVYERVKIKARLDKDEARRQHACATIYKIDKHLENRPQTTIWGTNKTFDTGN